MLLIEADGVTQRVCISLAEADCTGMSAYCQLTLGLRTASWKEST